MVVKIEKLLKIIIKSTESHKTKLELLSKFTAEDRTKKKLESTIKDMELLLTVVKAELKGKKIKF